MRKRNVMIRLTPRDRSYIERLTGGRIVPFIEGAIKLCERYPVFRNMLLRLIKGDS